jgi:uncharacterized protein
MVLPLGLNLCNLTPWPSTTARAFSSLGDLELSREFALLPGGSLKTGEFGIIKFEKLFLYRNRARVINSRNFRFTLKIRTLFEQRAVALEPGALEGEILPPGPTLVISDLHIGFEEKFKSSGVNIESNIDKMATELEALIDQTRAEALVIAGDVKSGIDRILQSEWENVPKFLNRISKKCRVTIVPGNHDGGLQNLLPDSVQLADINGLAIEDTLIIHGHTRPLSKFKDCTRLIMGHVHPIFQKRGNPLSGSPVWAFVRLSKKAIFPDILGDEGSMMDVIVVPSFNSDLTVSGYFGEEINSERRQSPIVRELKTAPEAIITTLNAEVIGDAALLPSVF